MLIFIATILLISAKELCHAQLQRQQQGTSVDGFIFPGKIERPDKYPITGYPSSKRPNKSQTSNGQWRTTTIKTPTSSSTLPTNFDECNRNCPTTSQYDPVCGDDNQTYTNNGSLNCAMQCGKIVHVKNKGRCPQENTR